MREPDRRGQDEDHRRDQPRHHADAEEDDGRDQVDEGRQRLHQVEDGPHPGVEPGPVRRRDADGHAEPHADHAGGEHERQALGRFLPVALVQDEEKAERHEEAGLPRPLERPGQRHEERDDDERVRRLEEPEDAVDHRLERGRDGVEDARAVLCSQSKMSAAVRPTGILLSVSQSIKPVPAVGVTMTAPARDEKAGEERPP
jgi:hypothetical protein